MPEAKQISSIILRRHPEYNRMRGKWDFWLDSYLSPLDEYANKYLFRNEKEGDEEFDARKKRAYREPHSKRCVDLVNTYLHKEPAVRKTDNKYIKDFFENADGRGKSISQFMKKVSLFSSILGRVYIVIDKKNPKEVTNTHRDNLASTPYCYMLLPQDVLDIAFEDDGTVKWALVEERVRDDDDPITCTGEMRIRYRLWTKGYWHLWDEEGQEVTSGATGLDIVPIIAVDNEDAISDYFAQALISEVSSLDRSIFNNYSRLDVIVNDQTFSQLIFPIEGALVGDVLENEKSQKDFLTIAANRILFYSASAEAKPEYISPDASQATFLLELIQYQTKQLYSSLGLQNEGSSETVDYKSGSAKSYDFDKLNKLLASKADNLEHAEERIVDIVKQWKKITADIEIEYPDEFDVKSLSQEILLAQELTLLEISDTFTKEVHKRVVDKALPKISEKMKKEIEKEIDAKDYDVEDIRTNINTMNNKNAEDETFSDKKASGKMGGRLNQDQTKKDQM